jgi:hypothetical protein
MLKIEVWPGYIPNPDFEYYIMTVDGLISGYFSNALDGQRINTAGNEGSFVVHYGSPGYEHEVSLEDFSTTLVPEPASFCVWGVLFLGLLVAGSLKSKHCPISVLLGIFFLHLFGPSQCKNDGPN